MQAVVANAAGRASWKYYLAAFGIAVIALLPRLDGFKYFHGKYLWAEDGDIFINGAQELGLAALTQPYAGYLHLYPRLVAELAQAVALYRQPAVLLLGWFLSYLVMTYALARTAGRVGAGIVAGGLLVGLASLQPSYGEVFFNITNSQWMLGAALSILVLASSDAAQGKKGEALLLLPLSLTGPFSIILSPVLLLRAFLKKDWASEKYVYMSVFSGALVQGMVLSHSGRAAAGAIKQAPWEWITTFLKLVSFGAGSMATTLAAVLFWTLLAYLACAQFDKRNYRSALTHPAILMLLTAFLMFAAGLYSHKDSPNAIAAVGGGNRYTWVPYVLIVSSAFLLSHGRKAVGATMALLFAFICNANFHKVLSPDIQFEALARYSQVQPVHIPIHPNLPTFPGFHVSGQPRRDAKIAPGIAVGIDPHNLQPSGMTARFENGSAEFVSVANDPSLLIGQPLSCPGSAFAGVTIHLSRDNEGWMQLFWSKDRYFGEQASLRRWYLAGKVQAQFAFPLPASEIHLRFDPLDAEGRASIEKIELHCL